MKLKEYKKRYEQDRFFQEVFIHRVYSPVMDIKNIDVVLDVGALAGEFSFWIYSKAKNIYAIEPDPENFKELVSNIKEFEFERVKPFNIALGGKNRIGHVTEGGRGGGALSQDKTPTKRDVQVKTLATFMKENNLKKVDVLKIDIEGGEKEVFEVKDFGEVSKDIKFIIGEHVAATSDHRLRELGFTGTEYKYGYIYKHL